MANITLGTLRDYWKAVYDAIATSGSTKATNTVQVGGSDGTDLLVLKTDAGGALQVDVESALPAGTNNIGDVDIASIAAGDNNIGNVDLASAIPAGTNNIGDVDILSIAAGDNNIGNVDIASEIPAGTQTIGSVKITDGTEVANVNSSNALEVALMGREVPHDIITFFDAQEIRDTSVVNSGFQDLSEYKKNTFILNNTHDEALLLGIRVDTTGTSSTTLWMWNGTAWQNTFPGESEAEIPIPAEGTGLILNTYADYLDSAVFERIEFRVRRDTTTPTTGSLTIYSISAKN